MLKTLGQVALASLFATAFAGTALAQDDDVGMDDEDTSDDWSSDTSSETTPDTSSDAPAVTASTSGGPTMGLSIPIFNNIDFSGLAGLIGGDAGFPTANLLYGLDANTYLDLQLGINFGPGGEVDDGMGGTIAGDDIFGLKLGVGYRMYKPSKGKIRPYLEPSIVLTVADLANAGDVIDLGLGARMGVDYALWEQFTLGAAIGADLNFNDAFDTITFNLLTTGMNATFWW